MHYIGIDCGGTHLRVGVIDETGQVAGFLKKKSPLKTHPQDFGLRVKEIIDEICSKNNLNSLDIRGIGVGVPGPLDLEGGRILISANLNNKEPINLKEQLSRYFNCPVVLDRDTNVSLRGEVWKGEGIGAQNALMLTLGTGVGGAILVNGQIDEGSKGMAGEIGHIFLQVPEITGNFENIPICGLGHRGCFEAFIKSTQELNKIGFYLGCGLASLVDIFAPEKIIIGGGMVNLGNFLPKAIEVMKEKGMKPLVDQVSVKYAKLDDLGGILGAAKLVIGLENN